MAHLGKDTMEKTADNGDCSACTGQRPSHKGDSHNISANEMVPYSTGAAANYSTVATSGIVTSHTSNTRLSAASFSPNAHGTFNNHLHDDHILLNGYHSDNQSALTACECVIAEKSKSCEVDNSESVCRKSTAFGDTCLSKETTLQSKGLEAEATDLNQAEQAQNSAESHILLGQCINNSETPAPLDGYTVAQINGCVCGSDKDSNTVIATTGVTASRYGDTYKCLFDQTSSEAAGQICGGENAEALEKSKQSQPLDIFSEEAHICHVSAFAGENETGWEIVNGFDTASRHDSACMRCAKSPCDVTTSEYTQADARTPMFQHLNEETDLNNISGKQVCNTFQNEDKRSEVVGNNPVSEYDIIDSSASSSDTELCDSSTPVYSSDDHADENDITSTSPAILQSPGRFLLQTFRSLRKPARKRPPVSEFFPTSKSLDHISHELGPIKSAAEREDTEKTEGRRDIRKYGSQNNKDPLSRVAAFFGLSVDEEASNENSRHGNSLATVGATDGAWGTSFDGSAYTLRQPTGLYSSLDEETFLHVNAWFQDYDTDACSRTETIYLHEYRCEEPAQTNMDISTGHIVLAYMEDHLANKQRLDEEWESLQAYEAEPNATSVATEPANSRKNRYADVLPYDHSRVVLTADTNVSASDYINASSITDHDPRNPAYIATQGPLPHTVADFWQMVWEQGSVVIVNLTKLTEGGNAMCHRYWPEEGSDLYHIYEVHLVSEHIWCDEYLVRSFYLKNLQTNETRTVTQFHFVAWPDLGIPSSIKVLLDFRRKVNKSYRGRSCPIVVHCSDGLGRTGTYCLIDMVLNRMSKGAKEIDIAATLEHIRDQRMQMVKTKEQFELALASVAEEVNSILKALPSS